MPKLGAVLFLLVLILTLLNPVWQARDNKVDEYRDLYRYQNVAKDYYRTLHASIYNLNVLASEMEIKGAFLTLSNRTDLLDSNDDFTAKIYNLYATLRTIPDPGDRGMVSAVYDSFEIYTRYHDLIFSGNYHGEDYLDILHDTRDDLRKVERDLFDELYKE